jgi:hypothetical protein
MCAWLRPFRAPPGLNRLLELQVGGKKAIGGSCLSVSVCVCLCVHGLMPLYTFLHRPLLHSRLCMFPFIFLQCFERRKEANQPANEISIGKGGKDDGKAHLSCSHWGQSWQARRAALPWLHRSHLPHQAPAHHREEEDKATMKQKKKNQKMMKKNQQ